MDLEDIALPEEAEVENGKDCMGTVRTSKRTAKICRYMTGCCFEYRGEKQ